MNRARRHVYLVMCEKINRKSKRDLQRLLARKNVPRTVSINALIKVFNKAMAQNVGAFMDIALEEQWRCKNDRRGIY